MAIVLSDQYPGKTAGPTANYPQGEPRNVTTPGDGTGTPWEAAIVKDMVGFQQALLKAANIAPSGQPDNANVSQYLAALQVLFAGAVTFSGDATQWSLKIKVGTRTLHIKGGNQDYSFNPGEIAVVVNFLEEFPTLCANVITTRKMFQHSENGDGSANLIGSPSKSGFNISLQTFNTSSVSDLRGFSWVAFGW